MKYLERLQELKTEVLGAQGSQSRYFSQNLQTNLYKITPDVVRYVKKYNIGLGVSLDVIPGVRRSLTGGESESKVIANLEVLRREGVTPGAIVVLAKHTAAHIRRVYDFYAERGMPLRVLPLFDGPTSRPHEDFAIEKQRLTQAMCELYDHWMDTGCSVQLSPLTGWLQNVIRHMLNLQAAPYDRRVTGEQFILVNTDGRIYGAADPYDFDRSFGDVTIDTWGTISKSDAYEASLSRDDARRAKVCTACQYLGACSTYPAFEADQQPLNRCGVAYSVHRHIERRLREAGIDSEMLRGYLREELSVEEAVASPG
jgi:uncharacterized protein